MSLHIVVDIAGDDPAVLHTIERDLADAQVEHLSGLGGLELIGTIAIPTAALVLQVVAMVRDSRAKGADVRIVHVHLYQGDRSITVDARETERLEADIHEALAKLK